MRINKIIHKGNKALIFYPTYYIIVLLKEICGDQSGEFVHKCMKIMKFYTTQSLFILQFLK